MSASNGKIKPPIVEYGGHGEFTVVANELSGCVSGGLTAEPAPQQDLLPIRANNGCDPLTNDYCVNAYCGYPNGICDPTNNKCRT